MAVLALWGSSLLLLAHFGYRPAPKAMFNNMMMLTCALVLLPLMHRLLYRHFWRNDERQRRGLPLTDEPFTGQPMPPPPPRSARTPAQTALYIACYVCAIAALLWLFLPLHHAAILLRFIGRHSSGSADASALLGIITAYLPMAMLLMPLCFFLNNDRSAINSHQLPAEEELRLRLKAVWLFSFVTALISTGVLCQMTSAFILRYL